jgi:hypothetical protein
MSRASRGDISAAQRRAVADGFAEAQLRDAALN